MKTLALILLCVIGASAISHHPNLTILEVAKKYGLHTILVDLGEISGLAQKVHEQGDWTIFAPTDAAFDELGASFVQYLRNDSVALAAFLKYHVVRGTHMFKELHRNDMELDSVAGPKIRVNVYRANQVITVEGCSLVNIDNVASNGVIHIIDEVMFAPKDNLYQTLLNDPKFSIMASMLKKSNLHTELENGPYTIFAPNNAAFHRLSNSTLAHILNDVPLIEILMKYHIVHGVLWRAGMHTTYLQTLAEGDKLLIRESFFGYITVENAHLVNRDIPATNGVIHEISRMLKPRDVDLIS